MDEDDLVVEEIVERIEKLEEENRELRQKLENQQSSNSQTGTQSSSQASNGKISRRKFLKMLGMGAGGLALSSSAAGLTWSKITPQSQGTSDIQAETAAKGVTNGSPFNIEDTSTGNNLFSATEGGPINIQNADLNLNQNNIDNIGSVSTENIGSERYYAGSFAGSDPDARLDNALSAASNGDTIYLENASYTNNRTFSTTSHVLRGVGPFATGTDIVGDWTFDVRMVLRGISDIDGNATITVNNTACEISQCSMRVSTAVQVNSDTLRFTNNYRGDVTFASGTSGGIVDSCSGTDVTDNGSNIVGDIA